MSVRPRRAVPRSLVALCLAAVCLIGAAKVGAATPGEITMFGLPAPCYPAALAAAPGEGVLTRVCDETETEPYGALLGATVANVRPSGEVTTLAVPKAASGPIVAGPGGELWIGANQHEFGRGPVSVQRLDPGGGVESFPILGKRGGQPKVLGLALGAEGATWAAVGEGEADTAALGGSVGGALVRIAPDDTETVFPVPRQVEPRFIVRGPDGNLWFTGVRGRHREEHTFHRGVGFVGRITPTGALSLYRLRQGGTDPKGIAVGPDGALWFVEAEAGRVGTIGTDGSFGRRYESLRSPSGGIAFGPEGDAWLPTYRGLLRLTPAGQQTPFPVRATQVVAGREGDIWALTEKGLARVVPGAPGLDLWRAAADRRSRTVKLRLACGGSTAGCDGHLELALGVGNGNRPVYRFGGTTYSVAAESRRTLTIKVPAKAIAVASRPLYEGHHFKLRLRATVEGGPTLERWIGVPSLR